MLTNDRQTAHPNEHRPSVGRVLGIAAAAAAGWVLGFYLGVFAVLALVGWDEFAGWQFLVATVSLGMLGATLAASLTHPDTRAAVPATAGTGVIAAVVTLTALLVIDGDYAVAILGGGAIVVGSVTAAGAVTSGH